MSLPSSLTVVYPPSFQNSFWSHPSYRPGAYSLYTKLQAGLDENESILAFVAHRAELEYNHAEALATPPPPPSFAAPLFKQSAGILHEVLPLDGGASSASTRGFAANTSATSRAFRMIQAETNTAHANAHGKIARHLENSILGPFGKWAADHRQRITQSWEHVDATLTRFERQKSEVDKLKLSYENKCRTADEAEDDVRFAAIDESDGVQSPPPSSDPALPSPGSSASGLQRSAGSIDSTKSAESAEHKPDPEKLKRRETVRKQFGFTQRATSATITPPSKQTEFAGVKLPPLPTETEGQALQSGAETGAPASSLRRSGTISALVTSAVEKMPAPIKAAVNGVVSAEPRHLRLRREADNAEKVYEESVRNLDRTRCQVEEVLFEHYGLTQRWEADRIRAVHSVLASYNQAVSAQVPILQQSSTRSFQIHQGLDPSLELRALIRQARTGAFHPTIQRFQPYYHDEISLGRKVGPHGVAHGWLVKNGGFGLNLSLVERLEYLERLERQQSATDADSTSSMHGAAQELALLPPVLTALLEALERAYQDSERWSARVRALSPSASRTEDKADDEQVQAAQPDAQLIGQEKRNVWILEVPLSITHRLRDALIAHLNPSLADLIYGSANSADAANGAKPVPDKLLDSYDPPVLAACVKLWLLELEHSLITEDLWDQIDAIYRAAAAQEHDALAAAKRTHTPSSTDASTPVDAPADAPADADARADADADAHADAQAQDTSNATPHVSTTQPETVIDEATRDKIRGGVLEDLRVVLNKLPRTHLACLDAVFAHLHKLVHSTRSGEADRIYCNKLGLSLGSAVLRPMRESGYTLVSPIATLVVVDLVQDYEHIFPRVLDAKIRQMHQGDNARAARGVPIRKRTKPVDERISRSSMRAHSTLALEQRVKPIDHAQPATAARTDSAGDHDHASSVTSFTRPHAPIASPSSPASPASPEPDHVPLSNVARLSRQFGQLGSSTTRGPRPSGARSARLSTQTANPTPPPSIPTDQP